MTVQQNLAMLESLHQDMAQAIIAMRDMIKFDADFTEIVRTQKYDEIKQMVGDAQRKSDIIEDFRSYGTWVAE